MRVSVKLYAALKRFAGDAVPGQSLVVELPEGATLQVLVERLHIPPEETHITFVNGLIRPLEHTLQPGDEVGIFPPIGGG